MKGKRTKKITLSISALAVVTAIITVVALLVNTQNQKAKLLADPEIQKSMEYEQVQEGDEKVPNTDYVQFDAFFLRDLDGDGYAEQVRGMCRDINKTDTLYMNLNVLTNGKLVDGKITIKTSNMNLSTAIVEDNVIKQNYISNNTTEIALKDINNGTQKLIYGTVNASNFGNDTNKYSQVNSVVLTGKHIADDGTETQISKTVDFNVDWYGSVTASIYNYTGTQNIEEITDENKENITLNFSVTTRETTDDLILKKAVLEGNIPTVNGYKPTSVELTSSDVNFEYDEETGNFTITREASINEAGIVTKTVSDYNTFTFKVTYPYELYESLTGDTLSLQVPVKAYYEGFNNPNDEFQNPVQSNIAERNITFLWRKPEGSVARFDVTIGKYRSYDYNYVISKEEPLKIYNGTAEETEDLYEVRWYAYTGDQINVDSIQMKENSTPYTDRLLNTESTYFNMSDYTKNVGIYFSNIENTLGEDGYIKVINDETGEEIHTFTKEDWNNYSSSSPYMYAEPVKHIRIETSKANKNASFYVYNIKEINDNVLTATFTKEEFDKLEYVYTYLTGNVKTEGSAEYTKINDDTANARYEEPISVASITVNRDTIGTQNTEKDIDLKITTRNDYYNMKGWTNGRFLVELPEEILDVEINSVNISNSSVKLLAYEIIEKDGKKFIKIETENENEANYTITINTNLTADPRSVTQSKSVKLYAYNEFCNNYKNTTADIYDVDGDENLTENVNYSTDTLNIVAPSSLLTNQQATNYNEAGETAVAPQIATIDKTEADTATVNVSVTNNYSGTISEVSILGKIPFEGNTFSINGTDLGSNYTTQMVDGGITVPEDMQDKFTVYYSEKENPTTDLNDSENGWTTTPDFSKVKTYLIDLGDYVLNVKENRVFTYQIKVPSTVSYNDVSYSAHAVYFCLDTAEGKFRTQTETTKLGFRIERKYHLNMTKVKENTTVPVQGATFSITPEGEDDTKLGTTNNSGTFTIQNLFVDKTYILKEIRTPGSYEKNETEVKFKVTVQDDKLVLQILEGQDSLKEYSITQATTDSRGILNFKVENTPKYKVILTKKDNTDGSLLAGVKYKLEGEGLGNGITVATNKEGTLTLTGLSHDVEYTLTETEAKDYYVNETPVKFKVVNNSGKLEFVVTSGSFNSNSQVTTGTGVTGLDAQDTVTAELTNEKIPTYQVSVKKFAKEEDTTLKGAQYKITGEGIDEKGATYTTDDTGVLTIPNLYEYVEGKNITGVYTLQEITPPEGYALDSRELQFRVKRNTEGALELEVLGDNFLRNSSVQDNTINLEFEDEPLFKITKIDGATKLPIQNAKFVIKEIDENYNELGFAKDINGNVVGTLEENVGAGSITFPLDEETYPWSKLEDGTYQSGISGLTSKTSTMTSKEFTLEKDGNISFEWAVSSESASYDYVYYTITNTKDNSTIGGTSTKIGGNKEVTDYNDLSFETVTEELEAGTYKIAFTYRTDSSNSYGLDSGFVKNIKVEGMNTQIPVVKTDENGEISYGLKAGLYKATEIEAPEGYELAENEADRTYYFGIGASKAQETEFGTSFNASVAGDLWNKVEAVESTTDNGFVTSGYFTKEADLNNDGLADVKGNDSYYSGFIAKYNKEGNMEIANSVYTESGEVILHKVIQTNDGGYVVGGSFTGTNLQVGEVSTGLTNTTNDLKGIVIKLSSSGSYEWAKEVAQEGLDYDVTALTQNLEGNIVAGVTTGENPKVIEYTNTDGNINYETTISANVQISDMDGYNSQDVIIVSQGLTDTTTGRIDLYSNGSVTAGSELDFNANAVARLDNGKAIIVGNYTGTAQTVKTKGNYDGIIIEYDINSSTINSSKFIRGTLDEVLTSVTKTTDGGYMIGGYTYSSQVDFNQEETTWEIPSISGNSDGFVIKYDAEGNQAWYKQVTGDNLDEVTGVAERDENEFVAVGYFNSTTVKGDTADSQGASLSKYSDGFVFNYGEIITAPEVPESSEITIENNLKKFQITTDVEEVDGVKGGTITGEDEAPYEIVEYGKDSTKEIKIVPDENYKIVKITVNGENYEFTPAEDGSFTMPQFTNMQTNKHIVVTFSNTASSVLVHHYIDGTQTKVAEDEHIAGTIGESYTTAPHMDLEEYELKQVDGEYVIPDNASGTFTQEEQVITYYYVKKQVPLTVHHYIEGTNEQVPLASGELAQDVVTKGEIGTEYTTVALTPEELNPKYELSITPSNANGIYSKDGVVVTYYYKAKNVEVTTTVQTHKETNEMGEEVDVAGGTISGQNQKPYETVVYGEDSKNDIVAVPDENYQVKQILINGEPLEFTPEEDGTVILNKFTDMTEDKHVVVEFEKIPAKVIVHYYIEGTTDKVPLQDGGTADDVTQTGVVGDIYATKPADNVNSMYELISTPTNASGTMTKDTIEVIYYYKLKATSVLVHHYKENTTEKLSNDVTMNGEVGDSYTTQVATDIPQNYELVATPANATGSMTEEQIVVTYYYRLKTPNITNQVINKTGTDRITVANQEMSYTVTYTANVTDYIGNAEVTIVDTLPYEIDEAKSDLAGGTYDSASKTITWKDNVSNIDSYNGNGTVNVTKTFKVVYVGIDIMTTDRVVNNVKGNIKLLTPEKTSEDVTGSQESTIYKAIISSEKLVDKTEAIEGEKVTYTIRITNEGNLAKTVTVRDTLPAGITFDNDTLIQVGTTGTVYTEQNLKNGIPVEVPANGSIDVVFAGKVDKLASNEYSKTLTNQATVDNEPTNEVTTNVTKANITAHKEAEPASGNKVRLGDEITYRIRVRNDGTREGTAIVKDTIPTGTTFVEGSVKIDNVADSTKTATDLQNGISITVGVGAEKVVEFKVTVNKLIDGTKIKNTAYINQNGEDKKVPEEPEHTYVEPKEEQHISKNGTATIENLNSEITYNINYTARITDYSGRATVKLIDTLPYAIDEARSDLAGGTYDAQAQTITWKEAVEGIQLTEEKEVTINKTVKVVYTGISQETTAIKNVVTGHIEYETPEMTSDEVTANWTTTTGFIVNIPVSKVWEDDSNKLGQRPTKVVFKLHGSDGSEYTKEVAKPGTAGSTTTQDSTNPNKWNDIFENLPKYDENKQEIVYTLTEEEKTEGDLRYYDSIVTDKTVTNTNKYGKVTVHHYIMNTDGSLTTTRVPDVNGTEIADVVIEGKEGDPYTTAEANNINEKYELVAERLPANATGTIEKYNEEKPQEVIYYYRLKPAKVLINYLEKDEDTDDSNNLVLTAQEKIDGHVDDVYNTDTDHRKETIEKDGKTYTLVSDSGNKTGNMTLQDITVTYYYLQNTKATVRYVERNPETHEIVKDLEEPTVKEGLVGDEFVTNSKEFVGYKLVESPEKTTIEMTKEEQTLIYYYEPVYTGLIENHIDDKTGKVLYTETHDVQVGEDYDIPSKEFEGYDLVESKLPENAKGTMGEELVTVNYYYIKKAVLEVNYIDKLTGEPLTEQIVDETKHEGDEYTTEQKTFENYDLIEVPENSTGTMVVETDEEGNITNNRTVVTYYYSKKSAGVEEHHIDIRTGEELEEPTLHEGHVGDEYDIKAKEFLSYVVATTDKDGNNVLPENAAGTMTEEKIVVNYYYNQPAKVIVHYVEKATGKELEETNPETGELQSSQVIIEGQKDDDYTTTAKEFEYYTLIEKPEEEQGKMKVEITKDEEGNDVVNNTIELYYYYEAKPFNIGVEKEITGIIVNGERRAPTSGKLEKVEIYRKSTEDTSVQVEYKIKVMNTGEVSGNATIEENIPAGMSLANNDGTWEEQEGKLIKVIPEIGPGETKEYTVLLNWEQSGNNMGEKANEVKLVETGNVPGFVDNNDKDNTSNANVIISVETGELPIGLILALVALVGLETVTLRYAVVLTKRKKKKVNKK
ncbi:MAG: MucBP domain-containing protein [Clostridia bacterium]